MKLKFMFAATIFAALTGASSAEDINVALAGPITGQYAAFGEQLRIGAQEAVKDINAAGGVLGRQLKLVVEDDACDPKQAVSVANHVVAEGAAVMIGHFCSGSTIPASEVYAENNLLEITVSSNPAVTDRGLAQIFRIIGGDDQQAIVAADFLGKKFLKARFAVVNDKSTYGQGLADLVSAKLENGGADVVVKESVNPGEKDYSTLITRLKAANVEVLYYGGYHSEAGLIKRQAGDAGLKMQLVGGDALGTSEFAAIVGATGNDTLFTFPADPSASPAAKAIVERLRANNINAEGYTLYAYASVQAFAEGVKAGKSVKTDDVAKVLRSEGVDTIIGHVKFDAKGNIDAPGFVMNAWDGSNYKPAIN
ncbi:ABC transporter substrate-binding protein [Mesorhizobium sp. AD1-1]|uniref:ABC transporter substrate-binding protein n=1 Tax=Mesorhizobium sp. AD1-1 TaxID=2876621 RepID=UPI001CC9BA2E|nr:ABC transporter substrate-binding protein [Mesorhizobium sp. AD1-1]MBZ9719191.1 ABC transporter substrate-binding protein [Mesorhizobium sp. AD1-1]